MTDELHGAEPVSRRRRGTLALAAVLLLGAVATDRVLAEREQSALQDAVVEGEQVVAGSAASQRAVAEYAGALLTREDVPPAARGAALATLGQNAARWEPRVRVQLRQLRGARVLPWHRDLRAARDAYDLRLRSWADALATVEREPATNPLAGADVREARERAQARLREAGVALRR